VAAALVVTCGAALVQGLGRTDGLGPARPVAVTAVAFVMWYSSVGRLGASRAGLLTGVAVVAAGLALGLRT
jgi:hypothetical protein